MHKKSAYNREEFQASIQRFWSGEVEWDVPLSEMTTLKTGGAAWAVIRPASVVEAGYVANGCVEFGL
ncbi:hypothetical protein, partial [Escherichia coli]|uniref:hypothetical protein n=1 Tax=Escherichia coli TaxID=562 RepID=UPI001AA12927